MDSYLQSLNNQRDEYVSAKDALTTALNRADTLFSSIMSVSEALEEIDIGGKGLDNGELPDQETYVNNVKTNIPPMIEYCNDKISELDTMIKNEEARIRNSSSSSSNTTSSSSSSSKPKLPPSKQKPVLMNNKE